MFTLLVVLLLIWVGFVVLGAVIKGLFWLAVVGVVLFVVTGIVGFLKREVLSRGRS
ncbi:MAG: hypothetical protein ACR2JX_00690 [Mycobacteriales bacterium]